MKLSIAAMHESAVGTFRTSAAFPSMSPFGAREGKKVGLSGSANAVLTDIVKRVERHELSPDPRHITAAELSWLARMRSSAPGDRTSQSARTSSAICAGRHFRSAMVRKFWFSL
jgi:hypothetical protein